ncbi:MAG TPA: TadE/TadG family type IV pilus assembly protein [Acidimicrobiales bacterium]
MRDREQRERGDRGAVVVEAAFVIPVLVALLLGVMELGWAFGQHLDVRHAAREGSRLAAVNYRTSTSSSGATQGNQIVDETCGRMDLATGARVTIARSSAAVGATVTVTVRAPLDQLTDFYSFALGGVDLVSTVRSRLEQKATWDPVTRTCP